MWWQLEEWIDRSTATILPMTRNRMMAPRLEHFDIDVKVLHDDGSWYPGGLEHWREDGERWTGYVRYTVGLDATHIAWVDQNHIRQA